MVFTGGPRCIFSESPLVNSVELLRDLERASMPSANADKSLTKKTIKNLKHNKHIRDKHHAKSSTPKQAPSPAMELAKITLRRAS